MTPALLEAATRNRLASHARPCRPLVAAATRTGLTLLVCIAREFMPLAPNWRIEPRIYILRALCDFLGHHIHEALQGPFRRAGLDGNLLYNGMFHPLVGGPKWLKDDAVDVACVRKYIGVRGMGDFTLITSHPRETLEIQDVLHSHEDPRRWLRDGFYENCTRFASVRHPAGAINSAMFSINALTSEYIQRFLPPEEDNDLIRQDIARHKLTNLDFFRSVLKYYASYLKAFLEVREQFILMRWEDLIRSPVPTILGLAQAASIPASAEQAARIWSGLDHVNLNGPHRHNYRRGKGIVDDWRNCLVNEHLDILREFELEPVMRELGYGPLPVLDPAAYTPFQKDIAAHIARGQVFQAFKDPELFGFSVQKSNVDWRDLGGFRGYDWRRHTRLERSGFSDQRLELSVWDAVEDAVGRSNDVLHAFLALPPGPPRELLSGLRRVLLRHGLHWLSVDYGRSALSLARVLRRLERDPALAA